MEKEKANKVFNLGLDLEREKQEQSPEDWEFKLGAARLCLSEKLKESLMKYLPIGELQFGVQDFMDCATRSPMNEAEAKFTGLMFENIISAGNTKWLLDKGYFKMVDGAPSGVTFSDRFIAILSGTTRGGNSLKAPVEAIRKYGLIPKSMLPRKGNMTWDMYHNKGDVTDEMMQLGQEFLRRFGMNYERVKDTYFLDIDCGIALSAWGRPDSEGVYQRIESQINHAVFKPKDKPLIQIVDNYNMNNEELQQKNKHFIKQLAPNYKLMHYGYRLIISEIWSEPIVNKDMTKTIKFETEAHIYKVSNADPLKIKRYNNWFKYTEDIDNGWAEKYIVVEDSLKPSYDIMPGSLLSLISDILSGLNN